jgi:hypothetical protein
LLSVGGIFLKLKDFTMSVTTFFIIWTLSAVAMQATAVPNYPGPTILFSKGQPLDELRGASILSPKGQVAELSLTMSPATLQVSVKYYFRYITVT